MDESNNNISVKSELKNIQQEKKSENKTSIVSK
jgi:hypothetical protein